MQDQNTNHLPANFKKSFRMAAAHVIKLGSVIKTFKNMEDLEDITLAPKVEGRITRTTN